MNNTASNPKCIPELRFPGFDGEWTDMKLGNIASFSKGKGISKEDISIDGQLECIRYGELYTHYGEVISKIISRTKIAKKDLVLSESNDIIIPASGETTIDISKASCVLKDGVALGGDLNIIKTKNNGVFLTFYLNFTKKVDIARLAQGISVVHLYADQLRSLNLLLPTIPEQSKIASFLTAVDDKIRQLTRKKELLEKYKKGVMQKIFNREIRFRDEEGKEYLEWEDKRLEEITESVKRKSSKFTGRVLTISAGKGFLNQEERFSKIIAGSSLENYTLLKKGEFSYNRGSSKSYLFGCIYQLKDHQEALVPNVYRSFKFLQGVPDFFEQLFLFSHLDRQLRKLISSSARLDGLLNIDETEFFRCKVYFPVKQEQQKIASFLSSLDQKITLVSQQIENMQIWKKGLLQKMFV